MAGRDTDDTDGRLGRGSETGSGNEAHRGPGESGQAEGANYAKRVFPEDNQPDPNHPRSSSDTVATGDSRRHDEKDEVERIDSTSSRPDRV